MAVSLSPLIFGCEGLQLTSKEIDFFAESQPFGFILFSRNLESPCQIKDLCNKLRLAVGWHVPIMIDQEGGRVSRLTAPHWFEFPPALDHADHINSERLFWLRGRLIAENLYSCGIDTNCAPLGDIASPATHLVLQNRCYGSDKATVIANALALDAGQRCGGVSGVLKHIPGHGRSEQDSHIALPVVLDKQAELSNTDFDVFRHLTNINMGMTAHLVFQDIDTTAPATHSKLMVDLIRNDIGFDGLLMTDDITMNALQGDVVQRAEKAWAVGCDIVLHCNGNFEQMYNLAASSGPLTDETKRRMNQVIANRPHPISVDILQLKEEFDLLMNE
jgi:beta-N-acetylhexosaminidase